MEGNKNKPRALMVFGVPGSGKSTFGEKFAHKFGLAYYNFDEIKEDRNLSRKDILVILELIMRTKQSIVLEGCMKNEKERIELRNLIREVYEKAIDELEAPEENEHPIILSGKHTIETQTKHVISGLAEQIDNK